MYIFPAALPVQRNSLRAFSNFERKLRNKG
jgi:hypothetical protein